MQPESDQQTPTQPGWQYSPEQETHGPSADLPAAKPVGEVSWTASEFIAHHKNTGWYLRLAGAGFLAVIVVFVITRDFISAFLVALAIIFLGSLAGRKPRSLQYQVDGAGIHIGQRSYPYHDFKSFSVIDEGGISSIDLMPLKRFMPSLSVYYEPQDEERIIAVLTTQLPFEEGKKDAFDRFMHRIRF